MANPNGRLIHGQKGTRLYSIWEGMKKRCNNPNAKNYKFYGGKGIKVIDSWNEFVVFMEWALRSGYTDELTIDRINSNKNYTPSNCRWIPMIENIENSTSTRRKPVARYTKDGKWICDFESVTYASKFTGIPKSNIFNNLSGLQKSAGGYVWKWILENR